MTEAALRERVERFVAATPRDAINHLLVAFFMNAILIGATCRTADASATGRKL